MRSVSVKSIQSDNVVEDISIPEISDDEVLVKVHAAGVNHIDLLWVDTNQDRNLGLEIAGEVCKSNSASVAVGQRVAALVDGGGYAEYAAVKADRLIPLPDDVSYELGAAMPESFITAFQSLFWVGSLHDNDTILIHSGSGAVGSAAIQLAKHLKKVNVITTASDKNRTTCLKYGADHVIDYHKQDFSKVVNDITDGKGVQLIIDFIGASYFNKNLDSLSNDGKLVLVGNRGSSVVKNVDLMQIMGKRLSIKGTLLSTRSNAYKNSLVQAFVVAAQSDINQFVPNLDEIFTLENAKQAQTRVRNGENNGKVIIKI